MKRKFSRVSEKLRDPLDVLNFNKILFKSVITPALLLFLLASILLVQSDRMLSTARLQSHSSQIIAETLGIEKNVSDIEASTRGVLLGDQDRSVLTDKKARDQIEIALRALRNLVADDSHQVENLDTLESSYEQWVHHLNKKPSTLDFEGQNLVNKIRINGDLIIRLEKIRQKERGEAVTSYISIAKNSTVILTIFLAAVLAFFSRRQLKTIAQNYKRANEILFHKTQALQYSNTELEHFAWVAAHDLKEPLRTITSHIQLIDKKFKDRCGPDATEAFNYVVEAARRMNALIDSLLSYSTVGYHVRTLRPVDTEEVLKTALSSLQTIIEERHAEVHEAKKLPKVLGDRAQLLQLFQNIISNAIKFQAEQDPKVYIEVEPKSTQWLFKVRDNGIGIASENAKKLFEAFRRFNPRDKFPGTGLGLAICKKIVERHGGNIWVESNPGHGTTFFFTLPTAT